MGENKQVPAFDKCWFSDPNAMCRTLVSQNQWCYPQTSDIRRTLEGNKIVDHSDVLGASPIDDHIWCVIKYV